MRIRRKGGLLKGLFPESVRLGDSSVTEGEEGLKLEDNQETAFRDKNLLKMNNSEVGLREQNLVVMNNTVTKPREQNLVVMNNTEAKSREQNLVVLLNAKEAMAKQKYELDFRKERERQHAFESVSEIKEDRDATQIDRQWTSKETLFLVEAKLKEHELFIGSKGNVVTKDERWMFVSNFLKTRGIITSKEKCREAWEKTLCDYRKVKEYEDLKATGRVSYFDMAVSDKKLHLLPLDMSLDLYQRLDHVVTSIRPVKGGLSGLKREAREKMFANESSKALQTLSHMVLGDTVERTREAYTPNIIGTTQLARNQQRLKKRKTSEMQVAKERNNTLFLQTSCTAAEDSLIGRLGEASSAELFAYKEAQRVQMASGAAAEASYSHGEACQYSGGLCSGVATEAASRQDQMAEHIIYKYGGGISAAGHTSTNLQSGGCILVQGSAELVRYIEDRKDARQKEVLAFEREKLAVLRDVSDKVTTALSNAVAILSNVVNEILRQK